MTNVKYFVTAVLVLIVAGAVVATAWFLITTKTVATSGEKPPKAAMVGKVVKEEELDTITLTEEAEKRIGLTIGAVEKKAVHRARVYGGEVMIPVGRAIIVAAPFAGVLQAAPGGEVKAGQLVKAGQTVFHLLPLLTPDARATLSASLAEAEGQVNNAKTQTELAQIALTRAKKVLSDGAGSQRQVDEAQAAYEVAAKMLQAASTRQTILKHAVGDAKAGTVVPIPVDSPMSGLFRTVSALPGPAVPAGAALFEVIDLSIVWVRVPLPVGDLDVIDRTRPAQVGKLSALPGVKLPLAQPIAAPPSANALASTVDVFYELPNAGGKLIPGQRLGVTIPLADARESLTVPWSALVFDVHGGTWVYEEVGSRRYARRRATVAYTVGPDAVLASGPPAGAKVVSAGVQELFGAETGFVK